MSNNVHERKNHLPRPRVDSVPLPDKVFRILTILGSPHDTKSNTRALVEDFVAQVADAGLPLTHRVIPLGRASVAPCRGCWACTRSKPCPIDDDLTSIKAAMLECDLLILACPVYTNQVTAQMKALFDRLFTWCHIFPLLGKYSLSACTTGNEGHGEVGAYLEKMLATYGTSSFGTLSSMGGFTPGFFPWRAKAAADHVKLARQVAETLRTGRPLPVSRLQRRMFRVMQRKMHGIHTLNWLRFGPVERQPTPSWLRTLITKFLFQKMELSDSQLDKLGSFMAFELGWWRDRGWLRARSFAQIASMPTPTDFDVSGRILGETVPISPLPGDAMNCPHVEAET